jgi:hypothetical protein
MVDSFSKRMGIQPVRATLLADRMDEDLRTDLWNVVALTYWLFFEKYRLGDEENWLVTGLWTRVLRRRVDDLPLRWQDQRKRFREWFDSCSWNEVYEFIEFLPNNYRGVSDEPNHSDQQDPINSLFVEQCNAVLERNASAYRFVGTRLAPITTDEEIDQVEQASILTGALTPVGTHIATALARLADREYPDYRNSIKESISAVETISRLISGHRKATLGDALKKLDAQQKVQIHPALRNAFSGLYGFASDASGIRHALMDESDLDIEDATFMLVACSAFVNYLVQKAEKAGIDLNGSRANSS